MRTSLLSLLIVGIGLAQNPKPGGGSSGGGGGGGGTANSFASCAGATTSCAIDVTGLGITTLNPALVVCFTNTGAAVTITGISTSGSPFTTITPSYTSTSNVSCKVNVSGATGPTGPQGPTGPAGSGISGLTTGAPAVAASSTTISTPCTTCTGPDSSGNFSTPGGISVGVGGSVAGAVEFGQGTAPTAGTTSVKLYAPASVTSYIVALPGAAATGIMKWTNSAGVVTQSLVSNSRGISFSLGDEFGSALTVGGAGSTSYITVPFACTITAYSLITDAADTTFRVKFWKVATGTAKPTSANSISTSGVGVPSGTAVRTTTVSDFTTPTVSANDMIGMALFTANTVKMVQGVLQCDQ